MTIEALCLSTSTASRTWDAPSFVLECMLHSSVDSVMVVIAFICKAASRRKVMGVAELLVCDAVLEAFNFGFGRWTNCAIDALSGSIDWDA